MRKLAATFLFACISTACLCQLQPIVIDSMKARLQKAVTVDEKVEALGMLSRTLMNVNIADADKYGMEMMRVAEESRDRKLIVKSLLTNGERYSYLSGRQDNIEKAVNYYKQGLDMARTNDLDELMISAYLLLSEVHRYIPDADKALIYSNEAFSYAGLLKNDSLIGRVYFELGSVYLVKSEKLLALRNYLSGLRLAEELDDAQLLRVGYNRLSLFYSGLEDYDRAIDFQVKAMNELDRIKMGQTVYNKVVDINRIGELYSAKKNFDMAMHYYERSLAMADSLKYAPIKVVAYRSIVNNYLSSDQPQKALNYFNSHPQLKQFLQSVNFGHFVDQSYGYIYMRLGKYDSAKYYYTRVAPFFTRTVNSSNQYSYYYQLGLLYRKTGEYDSSISYFQRADTIARQIGNLDQMSAVVQQLDSLYESKGDFKQALYFNELHNRYKDSLESKGIEKDLMQAEATDEQQRQARKARELEERKRRRNNIQYLGITIGIAALFIALVILGMFKVSAGMIKMIGFFAFIMFFEFIFLIFKKNIYGVTKGEPMYDLLFMIGLAAILLPLHHWLEEKAIHYLTSHNRLTSAGTHLKMKFFRRKAGE